MNPLRFWFGLFALFGVAIVAPAWMHYAGPGLTGVPPVVEWLVALMLPVLVMLVIASWVQPGGT